MMVRFDILHMENHCTRYVIWYDGTVWWMYYMAQYCLVVWYVSVYISFVRVEYVVRISYVTTVNIDH